MASKTLSIRYTADASGVVRAQAQIEKSVGSLGTKMQDLGRRLYSTGRSMTVGLTLPIVAGFKVAIDEATQFNQVQGQTAAALKSTGGAANVSMAHIDALSKSLGKLTAQDAEVVHQTENVLLTFTRVRNEVGKGNAIFDKASLAVQNIAARMGVDASQAAVQLGKALSQPQKGLTALRRIGVEFSAEQAHQIRLLSEHHHLLEAQKIILKEVTKEFGGSAKAMGAAASPLTKLNLAFRDFAQQIGPIVIQIVEKITGWLEKLMAWFQRLSPGMQKFAVTVAAVVAAMGPLLIVVGSLFRGVGLLVSGFQLLTAAAATEAAAMEGAAVATEGAAVASASLLGPLALVAAAIGVAVVATIKSNAAMEDAIHKIAVYGVNSAEAAGSVDKLGGKVQDLSHAAKIAGTRLDYVAGFQDKLNSGVKEGTRQNVAWFRSINKSTLGIDDYRTAMKHASQVSETQATKIAVLINGYEQLGGKLGNNRTQMLSNLLAYGDVTDAVKLLKRWLDALPSRVSTTITTPGLENAISRLQGYNTLWQIYTGHGAPTPPPRGGGHKPAALGFHGYTNGPTWFLAGEGSNGRERVDIGGGGGTTVIVNVAGSVTTERDLIECIRKGVLQIAQRNGGRTGL